VTRSVHDPWCLNRQAESVEATRTALTETQKQLEMMVATAEEAAASMAEQRAQLDAAEVLRR
jgi:hypothetical protein